MPTNKANLPNPLVSRISSILQISHYRRQLKNKSPIAILVVTMRLFTLF